MVALLHSLNICHIKKYKHFSDTSVKQIILGLNEKGEFIIEDLDDTHVFVDSACIEQLRADIDEILNENTYKVEESK
ncbi:hypothetical protein BGX28_000522 [Mortierella sp. GBA30]|nr:hypothetical protein BGX28_000522 [Mortierella sp. GBA30]